mmetsp:Transcript_26286/g.32235  ORF Transcript_26286/g.32235 Transcript_26286/m.32235 type:complete len:577 (-) Transcript_26286:155-1885(-)
MMLLSFICNRNVSVIVILPLVLCILPQISSSFTITTTLNRNHHEYAPSFFNNKQRYTTTSRRCRAFQSVIALSAVDTTNDNNTPSAPVDDKFYKLASDDSTQTKLTPEQVVAYNAAIESLPLVPPSLDVNSGWRLLATISPEAIKGDNVDFFDINSWKNYIGGKGPSPFQSLITGSSRVSGLTQYLTPENFDNMVEFQIGPINGKLILKADQEDIVNNKRIFRFKRGFFILQTIWGSAITLPYPVPFALLGDRAIGWLETTHYDEASGFRAAVGNKGTKFIFQQRREDSVTIPADVALASEITSTTAQHETDDEERAANEGLTKRAIVICPQQFGGKPGDYTVLTQKLRDRGYPVYLTRLSALQWLSITKSAFSAAYIKGELEPRNALGFYMNAVDETIQRLPTPDTKYTILSHSIGGWVARAWLGEVASESVRKRCTNFVSLGTPHLAPPPESLVSKVDQTRGLLKYVNDKWPGAYWDDVSYTCVASKAVPGKLGFSDLDCLLGYVSYLALIGDGKVDGDGITPVKGALLEGAASIVLDDVYHADVLPNPIGSRNTKLIGCKWYADQLDEWVGAL